MNERQIVRSKFWPPTLGDGDTNLYSDEIGWRESLRPDNFLTDTKRIFDFHVKHYGFDLVLFFLDDNRFYYCDMHNGEVLRLDINPQWDGTYQYQMSDPVNKHWFDNEVLFEFDDAQQLWSEFTLDGHNLKYVIEHSVVDIMH